VSIVSFIAALPCRQLRCNPPGLLSPTASISSRITQKSRPVLRLRRARSLGLAMALLLTLRLSLNTRRPAQIHRA
jgi:hypothetical protein